MIQSISPYMRQEVILMRKWEVPVSGRTDSSSVPLLLVGMSIGGK